MSVQQSRESSVSTHYSVASSIEDQISLVQSSLDFKEELVAANSKVLMNGIASTRMSNAVNVMIEDLKVLEGFNVRVKNAGYYAHIREIADSILANGFYQSKALTGYGAMVGKRAVVYITDGHCRYEAAQLAISEGAPIADLPVIILDKAVSMEDLTVSLVRSNQGKRLEPLELAIACKRLAMFGWKPSQIAERVGITTEYVHQLLLLAGSPKEIRAMVEKGEITAAAAVSVIRAHGGQACEVMGAALQIARENGKQKVTPKYLPEKIRKKAFIKNAPAMYSVLERMRVLPSYSGLPSDIREIIEGIIESVPSMSSVSNEKDVQKDLTLYEQ